MPGPSWDRGPERTARSLRSSGVSTWGKRPTKHLMRKAPSIQLERCDHLPDRSPSRKKAFPRKYATFRPASEGHHMAIFFLT